MNKRIFVERKLDFQLEKIELQHELEELLGIHIPSLRYYLIYDLFNISESLFNQTLFEIFVEVNKEEYYFDLPKSDYKLAYEFLPGQFDQRSDAAEQCIKLIDPLSNVIVKSGIVITYDESLSNNDQIKLKQHLINTVEAREKDLNVLQLHKTDNPTDIPIIQNFILLNDTELMDIHKQLSLAMSLEDLQFIQEYFIVERRNPTETEIRVLDTYWSDHCRHTTFETKIDTVTFVPQDLLSKEIETTFQEYLNIREYLSRSEKPITLMDIATINAKYEYLQGRLPDLEISDEINAASIFIDVEVDSKIEKWLMMFKNETHNHPTEIEPFGGASTCIGGAIRDPLSGRSYVYSAMRVTGAADITEPLDRTIEGKLPQRIISKKAAQGYSSYGNQIGLATTFVEEIHHPGYKAKRMEIGAVIGAVKADYVRREKPQEGDVILLIGGATGRDGIGGATGSSKEHTEVSLEVSSAEVQKGNAPEERKLQRLFRNPLVTRLIKKSNDFGAGGVSVAIGELADGIIINLDKVPTKYQGINGTELAISESQERMAVVVSKDDVQEFFTYCEQENIGVSEVAKVTREKRLIMMWRNQEICNITRDFIETSGVRQRTDVRLPQVEFQDILSQSYEGSTLQQKLVSMLKDLNISSKQGLEEMFDSSIGRTTVLSPYGGKYALTKTQVSCQIIPTRKPKTKTVSLMAYGFNPKISERSPYHGSVYAIVESMAKIVAAGGQYTKIRFTFQEYFQKLYKDPLLWSKPFSALLGAFKTLKEFGLAAIGGKDSMSGTYQDMHVPPTLVSFAVCTAHIDEIISPEFKQVGSYIYVFTSTKNNLNLPSIEELKINFDTIHNHIKDGNIISAYALGYGGLSEAVFKCSFGNKIGAKINTSIPLFDFNYGAILVESTVQLQNQNCILLGQTVENVISINDTQFTIDQAIHTNQKTYQEIYPIYHEEPTLNKIESTQESREISTPTFDYDHVRVLIPVFPGTNCEYDSEDAFLNVGAVTKIIVFNNQDEDHIQQSIQELANEIDQSHIIMFSGGFSSGDEPDGSGKFIANILRNQLVKEAIERFLQKKHLILGICNGFQALVKSGLLPVGDIQPLKEDSPTLFKNKINRHVAKFIQTKVSNINSPWLSSFSLNETHSIPVSHGEGQFIVSQEGYNDLRKHNQIAFQYVDDQNQPTMNPHFNPNGSSYAIEGIVSQDGLILGKMGHSERYQNGLYKNVSGNKDQNLFQNAIDYFTKGAAK